MNVTLPNVTHPVISKTFAEHALELSAMHGLSLAHRKTLHGHMYTCVAREPDVLWMHRKASLRFCESLIEDPKDVMHVVHGVDLWSDLVDTGALTASKDCHLRGFRKGGQCLCNSSSFGIECENLYDEGSYYFEQNFSHYGALDFRARQVIAAHQLSDCEHVLEIGGHLHPLTELLQKTVTVVDEYTVPYFQRHGKHVKRHLKITWQEWQRLAMGGDEDCLAFIGASVIDTDLSNFLVSRSFKLVVLEYAVHTPRAASSVKELLSLGVYKQLMSLGMDMETPVQGAGSQGSARRMLLLQPAR